MESFLAILAAVAATLFSLDLWSAYWRRPRPHVAAYAAGISMFAVATWALFKGMTLGWDGATYRTFYLFGAILNIPILAIGSMFLVVGKKSGHFMTLAIGALAAISTTLTLTMPFENPLPADGVPEHIFGLGFSPRLFAIIGGAAGSTILVALALTSVIRFWKRQRTIVWGNALILGGVFAAAWGGTGLALGAGEGFALSLLLAVTLIWAGYRVASGQRGAVPSVSDSKPAQIEETGSETGVNHLEGKGF